MARCTWIEERIIRIMACYARVPGYHAYRMPVYEDVISTRGMNIGPPLRYHSDESDMSTLPERYTATLVTASTIHENMQRRVSAL